MQNARESSCDVSTVLPLLKWPGGKRWLAPVIVPALRGELRGKYYEPFIGGGAVFLSLNPGSAVLSDTNQELITCLRVVRKSPDKVVRAVWRLSNSRECYYRVRRSVPRHEVTQAARFVYLNRTCWGGIYRLNRSGEFNVPFGDSGRTICCAESVLGMAARLKNVTLATSDFEAMIDKANKGDVVYCDPPYTVKGENNGFVRYNESIFRWSDQERLMTACSKARRRGVFVVVSGLCHPNVRELYRGWWSLKIPRYSLVSRDVESRKSVNEIVFFSRWPSGIDLTHQRVLVKSE